MLASDVLNLVLKNISREDILKTKLFDENSEALPSDEQNTVVEDLLTCLNDAVQSLVYIYFPLKKLENITVDNNQFEYQKLQETLIEVLKIRDANGVNQKFTTFPTFFTCPSGKYTITYSYAPKHISKLSDSVVVPREKVTDRVLATSTTSKFYLKRGMYQDSNAWDLAFQRMMLVGQRPKHIPKMDSRGWY